MTYTRYDVAHALGLDLYSADPAQPLTAADDELQY